MAVSDVTNSEANRLVETYIPYIHSLAQRLLSQDGNYVELDELIQRVSIKFWLAAKLQPIKYPKAYLARIVNSVYVDMQREYKPVFPLSLNNEGELLKGTVLVSLSEGMGDPQDVLEREEAFFERLDMLSYYITRLPRQQRYAMLLRLKKRVDNLSLLARCLRKYKVSIENVHSPIDKAGKQKLASSVAPAITKIDAFFKKIDA